MNNKLRNARKGKGFTQAVMAKKLGYSSKSGYSMIETGRNTPPLQIAIMIAKLVEKTVEELFDENEVHESKTSACQTA
ncbi:helix-turn-helix transcriptional regulator [Brevibacillus sp. SYSU BS000544]|uniref:helix-turn-helix transcriptional regulator n=1 Tax=Brevibacillus sp. SYSU BS000544 TaxID=3416443 RepID=UPI003CE493C0